MEIMTGASAGCSPEFGGAIVPCGAALERSHPTGRRRGGRHPSLLLTVRRRPRDLTRRMALGRDTSKTGKVDSGPPWSGRGRLRPAADADPIILEAVRTAHVQNPGDWKKCLFRKACLASIGDGAGGRRQRDPHRRPEGCAGTNRSRQWRSSASDKQANGAPYGSRTRLFRLKI